MKIAYVIAALSLGITMTSCKKEGCTDPTAENYNEKAKKEDGSCIYIIDNGGLYTIPSTYNFTDDAGNSTVYYGGQTERLNQLEELVVYAKLGNSQIVDAQVLKDMFANTNGNGNGNFSFTSTKQLKDKCFTADQNLFETWMDELAIASQSFSSTASSGQAGILVNGSSTYLFDANGVEHAQLIEKGLMGAVFFYQALNVYFGDSKMNVDNSTALDPMNGEYYTAMEHHWDEAFGYFGVEIDFPSTPADRFWGKYCMAQNSTLNCNADMMNNFLKGRAAIVANIYTDRDAAILAIRKEWEEISAYQAMTYLDQAIANFGTNNALYLHALSEAYAFAWNLRYAPLETRRMNNAEHANLMALFNTNFWSMSIADINAVKAAIDAKF